MTVIRDAAQVTIVGPPVDGTKRRRPRDAELRPRGGAVRHERVHPAVMEAALPRVGPGQRLVVVSPTCVRIVNS